MLRLGLIITICAILQVAVFADARMVSVDGHTMVRLRAFCRQFGAVNEYDAATNTYRVSRQGRTVYLIPYSSTAWVDDRQVELRYPPVIIDGTMYVPLRFMCRTFNLNSTWGADFRQVIIFDSISQLQVTWARDDGWAARPHTWQHPVTYRVALSFPSSPRQSFHGKLSLTTPSGRHIRPPVVHTQTPIFHNQPTIVHNRPSIGRSQPPAIHNQPPTTHQLTPKPETKSSHPGTGNTSDNHNKDHSKKSPSQDTNTREHNKGDTRDNH